MSDPHSAMPPTPRQPCLLANNPALDMAALEARLEELLAAAPVAVEPPPMPAAPAAPGRARSAMRRVLFRLRTSWLVSIWLPRHPGLYQGVRAVYRGLRRLARRA